MSLKTCYEALGGNYDEALGRLMSERIMQKFVLKFLNEGSYDLLMSALDAKDGDAAFRAAHTLKGVASNLGMTLLQHEASEMTEALRGKDIEAAKSLMPRFDEVCGKTISALGELLEE